MADGVTAFFEDQIIAKGSRADVTRRVEEGWPSDQGLVRVFDDATGRPVDLDLWDAGTCSRRAEGAPRPRGRPRLGVIPREVTLLPRHWEWLSRQPGGASATLRRLVEAAARQGPGPAARRDAAFHFLSAMAGDRPGFEEAMRALYRGDRQGLFALADQWPNDIREYARTLLGPDEEA